MTGFQYRILTINVNKVNITLKTFITSFANCVYLPIIRNFLKPSPKYNPIRSENKPNVRLFFGLFTYRIHQSHNGGLPLKRVPSRLAPNLECAQNANTPARPQIPY